MSFMCDHFSSHNQRFEILLANWNSKPENSTDICVRYETGYEKNQVILQTVITQRKKNYPKSILSLQKERCWSTLRMLLSFQAKLTLVYPVKKSLSYITKVAADKHRRSSTISGQATKN